jgi:hypothetical protein
VVTVPEQVHRADHTPVHGCEVCVPQVMNVPVSAVQVLLGVYLHQFVDVDPEQIFSHVPVQASRNHLFEHPMGRLFESTTVPVQPASVMHWEQCAVMAEARTRDWVRTNPTARISTLAINSVPNFFMSTPFN